MTPRTQYWDIFCAVVDNYGDIGVSWRLAKQLVLEYPLIINLWVDDLFSFSHILPQLDPSLMTQYIDGINIHQWNTPLDIVYIPGHVIIEAFACKLPNIVIEQLNQRQDSLDATPPLWLNLEYLSAETWVDECHGLPSLQTSGLKKFFYFPGFTPKTGGLICEKALFNEREQWQSHPQNKLDLFTQLGLTGIHNHDEVISVFSYETQALAALCALWQTSEHKIHLLIPKGRSLRSLIHLLPCPIEALVSGQQIVHQSLTLHILPMTDQQGFDRLLWSCDLNIVRGEDSFLRAQWAAKPFIWHIYPQEDDYHLVKLEAFMQIYCDNLAPEIAKSWSMLNVAFNQGKQSDVKMHWHNLDSERLAILHHAQKWPNIALNNADLATRLIQFVQSCEDAALK
ncbi:elongation factor P maturation arginine rhamnosyltransferase EarP [Shewanella sp. VB17]|uniref:elongation factor P maturation arginine rhamnosyltransferase EarP n=1 Tax=Shewanella sp. VB17 TaxID=2739432 RepID=UPI001564DF75|nr:elongation factor P maturation arginine rhamnosyltransferase EarP [Shewanella sp. VB17]NRD73981.1 elongation factor P maturation arginine rhamnosyltransferase EarP [Shewanella sp. VB17]